MKRRYFSILALTAMICGCFLLTSCLPERKVAQTFIQMPHSINLLVFPPEMVYKYNHKGEMVKGFDSLSDKQQDSALWVDSKYIQFLSDSILLESYMNHFIDQLRALGFNVYLSDAIDSFLVAGPQSYQLEVSQIQLDEYLYPLRDEQPYEDTVYSKVFDLNAVDFSCWFDLCKAHTQKPKKTVLFSAHTAYDSFDGRFYLDPWVNTVHYKYSIDSLKVKDIYEMANYLGEKHAGYLYDYFLNQYVAKNLPQGEIIQYYYHYDLREKRIIPVEEDEMFEILGTK
ncbi:MAG: hypothetical protein M0P47_11390 [Bacteroidales bacterium]|nr:hypothetical protein [Bacteroidales bacterium]